MAVLGLFFLLKDGPTIRSWSERRMGVPSEVAHTVTERTLQSLRGYFLGVTIVAVFSAVLVGGGALALGVPLAGTIAVITFIGGYVPYLGAWTAGAFSVLLALGGAGTEAAAGMVVIQLLSNGPLQQIVPVAYGAALGLHPLAVLVLTISGRPVRNGGADPRRPDRLGDRADLRGPLKGSRRASASARAPEPRPRSAIPGRIGAHQRLLLEVAGELLEFLLGDRVGVLVLLWEAAARTSAYSRRPLRATSRTFA